MDFFKNLFTQITPSLIFNLCITLIAVLIFKIVSAPVAYIIIRIFRLKEKDKSKIKKNAFYKPLQHLFVILGIYLGLNFLSIPENIYFYVAKFLKICVIIVTTKGFANIFSTSSDNYERVKNRFNFSGNDTVFSFASKIIRVVFYIIAGFAIMTELGYNLNGLATGLGISSVVVALAAQDLAKSVLGGLSIIVDKPFEIGDYIETNNYAGTVEDITFRSTRIRDINNQIIIIPNSEIAESDIINCSKREKRRYYLVMTLDLATPLEKVSELTEKMKLALTTNKNIYPESVRVLFDTISANGIDISVHFYTDILDFPEFLKFKELINYTLLQIIEENKVELAYNSQTIYLKKD